MTGSNTEHMMVTNSDFLDGTWSIGCSCGWDGFGEFSTEVDAIDDWENHCDVVFMEATREEQP